MILNGGTQGPNLPADFRSNTPVPFDRLNDQILKFGIVTRGRDGGFSQGDEIRHFTD